MKVSINSTQRLDANITMTFVEFVLATSSMIGAEGERMLQQARGSYAPYRIWNRTGYPLFIWSDTEGSGNTKETNSKQIPNGKTIDWRFDDWKTMREVRIYILPSTSEYNAYYDFFSMYPLAGVIASGCRSLASSGNIFAAFLSTGKANTHSPFDHARRSMHTVLCAKSRSKGTSSW